MNIHPLLKKYIAITSSIDKELAIIKEDTGGSSLHAHVVRHKSFNKIVAMGDKIIPYIFHLIIERGSNWILFLILEKITNQNPVPIDYVGRLDRTLQYWLQWYLEKEIKVDMYYNLVKQ